MAKILDIKRFAVHDGDGIRTTVFFKGCPLKCVWCHNPEGINREKQLAYYQKKCVNCGKCVSVCEAGAHKMQQGVHVLDRTLCVLCGKCEENCLGKALRIYGQEMTVDELLPILLQDKHYYEISGGGVTLSGGECLLYPDYCEELLTRLKNEGIHTAIDTCGFVKREVLNKIIPVTDVFLYDIKAINETVHEKCTGQTNKQILDNLKYLDESGAKLEIRIPYVPGFNEEQIPMIAEFLSSFQNIIRVRVLPYHNFAGSKYQALGLDTTMPERLPSLKEIEEAQKKF